MSAIRVFVSPSERIRNKERTKILKMKCWDKSRTFAASFSRTNFSGSVNISAKSVTSLHHLKYFEMVAMDRTSTSARSAKQGSVP